MSMQKKKRLQRANGVLATMPIRKALVDEAWEWFEQFGELPEEPRVADAVARRALGSEADTCRMPVGIAALLLKVVPEHWQPPPPSVRMCLFDEAVFGEDFVRRVARVAITLEVARGGKVTDPQFAAHHGLPKYGTVGLHVLGFPQRLAVPPYEEQAHRLFARREELLDRIDRDDPHWFEPIWEAMEAFRLRAELPGDELVRDIVLAEAELAALGHHKRGKDVKEMMTAFDVAARGDGAEREAALLVLQHLHERAGHGQ